MKNKPLPPSPDPFFRRCTWWQVSSFLRTCGEKTKTHHLTLETFSRCSCKFSWRNENETDRTANTIGKSETESITNPFVFSRQLPLLGHGLLNCRHGIESRMKYFCGHVICDFYLKSDRGLGRYIRIENKTLRWLFRLRKKILYELRRVPKFKSSKPWLIVIRNDKEQKKNLNMPLKRVENSP